jgi:glycosyltransferase involved in cell wall biosynthesis
MRILLDLQGCQSASRLRGIGRYTVSLAKAIARNAGEHDIFVLLNALFPDTIMPLRREFNGLIPRERIVVFTAEGPAADCNPANARRARLAELLREYAIAQLQPDVVHIGSLFEGCIDDVVTSVGRLETNIPTAVTLYDLIPLLNPDRYIPDPTARAWYYRKLESLKRADLLLAISQAAANETSASLRIDHSRVVNIGAAADERFRPRSFTKESAAEIRKRFGLSRHFLLYVGVIESRKNFEGLIHAYGMLPDELRATHQLLLIAQGTETQRTDLCHAAAENGVYPNDLIIVDRVSDDDLVALYSLCRLFVFPSLHEGFGLPALEAMSCGAAVVGANTTSIPEVIGREDALFDPTSPTAIAQVIRRALADEGFQQSLRQHALRRAREFSWNLCAERAIKAFENLGTRRKSRSISYSRERGYRHLLSAVATFPDPLSDEDLVRAARAIALNAYPSRCRQLLVDVSVLAERDAQTGIQRVTRAVLGQLLSDPPPGYRVEPIRFDLRAARYRYARTFARAVSGGPASGEGDEWTEVGPGDVFLGLDLGAHLVPSAESWWLGTRQHGVKVAFVVYDILPLRRPDWWRPEVGEAFAAWFRTITKTADLLVTISQSVAHDIRSYLDEEQLASAEMPEIAFFQLGADIESSVPTRGIPEGAREMLATLVEVPTFLMVGTVEPRKGYAQVLEAFSELWQIGLDANLVIVGQEGWLVDDLARDLRNHPLNGRRLFWLAGISDEYLTQIYSASTCLICASEGEGFGLPLIEAARHRLPIIARDIPVFREVAGTHAFYFSGRSKEALADAIRHWLRLKNESRVPESVGMSFLTWADSTRELLAAVLPPDQDDRTHCRDAEPEGSLS